MVQNNTFKLPNKQHLYKGQKMSSPKVWRCHCTNNYTQGKIIVIVHALNKIDLNRNSNYKLQCYKYCSCLHFSYLPVLGIVYVLRFDSHSLRDPPMYQWRQGVSLFLMQTSRRPLLAHWGLHY